MQRIIRSLNANLVRAKAKPMLKRAARKMTYLILLLGMMGPAAQGLAAQSTLHPWEVYELGLTARKALANPYADGLPDNGEAYAQVIFTGTQGEAKGRRLAVRAFWDGGNSWKARFAPPAAGEWSYRTESTDPGLNGKSGSLSCAGWSEAEKKENPLRRGFLRVARDGERAGRYFTHADGTPFLWIGDTWWNWAKPGIHFETFQKLVEDRAAKGFSVGQVYFNSGALLDPAATRPGLEEIRRVERMIAYANRRGITIWISPWWGGKGLPKKGAENIRRWERYLVDRLGAYHVIWVLASEYNMDDYSGLGLPFWQELAAAIRRQDPYGHLVSAHPTPPTWNAGFAAPQWSTAEVPGLQGVFDFNQSQVGHGRASNEMIPTVVQGAYGRKPAKPIVVTEPWYEFIEGSAVAEDIRFGAWSAMLSGAAGHSYGGGHVWWAHVPEAPVGPRSTWPLERGFEKNTLDYPGARSLAFMAHFLRSIDWWRLEPHPELLRDTSSRYCAAAPGREYLVYLRWGGLANLDLSACGAESRMDYTWFNLTSGQPGGKGTVAGGAVRRFHSPEGYPARLKITDWVLWVRRRP